MEDFKEGYLMVRANYMSPCNSIAGLYISYHGNAQGAQKRPLNFSFCKLSEKLIRRPTMFISLLESSQAVRGPITKINQSKCSIAGPIFSKYWTGHCPE